MENLDQQILGHLIELKEGQARVEATLITTVKMYDDKFESITEDIKRRDSRQFWVTAAVLPVVAGLHQIAARLGFIK